MYIPLSYTPHTHWIIKICKYMAYYKLFACKTSFSPHIPFPTCVVYIIYIQTYIFLYILIKCKGTYIRRKKVFATTQKSHQTRHTLFFFIIIIINIPTKNKEKKEEEITGITLLYGLFMLYQSRKQERAN